MSGRGQKGKGKGHKGGQKGGGKKHNGASSSSSKKSFTSDSKDFTIYDNKSKNKGAAEGGSKGSVCLHKNGSGRGGASHKHDKENREDRKRELLNRPQIFLTPEKKESMSMMLSQLSEKKYDEQNANTSAGQEFQKKYECNLAANATASITSRGKSKDAEALVNVYSAQKQDPNLDAQLKKEMTRKANEPRFIHMQHHRRSLPAYECSLDIINLINKNQVVVICGETGCGKTTQVPQYILDDAIEKNSGSACKILCTQPRRISAVSVAERVAEERGESIGTSVGYSIRLESRLPSRTAGTMLFVTTGVVFQYLKEDPDLSRISMIIVDEVHERDILTDFLLVILKELIKRRSDLKVVLMSATLNAGKFSSYFNKCPIFTIPGLSYPVTSFYLEDVITKTKFTFQPSKGRVRFSGMKPNHRMSEQLAEFEKFIHPYIRKLEQAKYPKETTRQLAKPETEDLNLDLIQALIEHICAGNVPGAILVFMPGWDSISSLHRQLQGCGKFPYSKYLLIPLHSLVPSVNQREVFNPAPGKRKIILSTNIAETSITINDVVFVIDSGKIKVNNFDVKKNVETLDLEWCSLANATQRRGRAGRVQQGFCYYLYTKARESALEEFKKPEILRKRLEEVILQIKMLKLGSAASFLNKVMDPPSEKAVTLGIERLITLNALDIEENLTPLGYHLAHLPMDPHTGKMILFGAIFSCVDPIFSIAASLSFKDAFYVPMGAEKKVDLVRKDLSDGTRSDHMVTVRAIEGFEKARLRNTERDYAYKNYLSMSNLNMLINLKAQFATYLYRMNFLPSTDYKDEASNKNSKSVGIITGVATAGLYPNVAQVKMKGKKTPFPVVYTEEDGLVHIHPKSINSREVSFECPFLIYHQKMKSSKIYLYDTTMVSPFPLVFFGGNLQWAREKGYGGTIVIDNGRIRFGCLESQVFQIVDSLRKELDKLLEYKISNPGPTRWAEVSKEGTLLKAIIQLITTEYRMLMNTEDSDFDTSTDDDDDED